MSKDFFSTIPENLLSEMQIKSAQNILKTENLYYTENIGNERLNIFKSRLVKIGTIEVKDNKTSIDMLIDRVSRNRVILLRENSKEFFIVSSLWLDVL